MTECPACGSPDLIEFHRQRDVPVNSCLLLNDRDEAASFPTGPLVLARCGECGFVTNTGFDPRLAEYSDRYEETQAFSPRFVEFARGLAQTWVDRHDLRGKSVLEIGCGKGEFLVMMAEAGIGKGIGIDPGVHPERIDSPAADRLEWIADFYSAEYSHLQADVIVCRHTLEHISPVRDFLTEIRTAIGNATNTKVLFELPDAQRVLEEVAFWDVYYEHCSYFTAGSLARLFERCGFAVTALEFAYDDQYLLLDAVPVPPGTDTGRWPVDDMEAIATGADHFGSGYRTTLERWAERIAAAPGNTVIWGAGSKGVSFLSEAGDEVAAAVDINPYKHGMYMAGTGHRIISPEELPPLDPALVIAMNPVYLDEIQADLDRLGLRAELVAL